MSGAGTDLRGVRVLLLENDYFLATDLAYALEDAGAQVIGPFADESEAREALARTQPDCALVDVNLGDGPSFDLPRELARRAVPFGFVTGYDRQSLPEEFAGVARLEKPVETRRIMALVTTLLRPS